MKERGTLLAILAISVMALILFVSVSDIQQISEKENRAKTIALRPPAPHQGLVASYENKDVYLPPRISPYRAPETSNIVVTWNPATCDATTTWPADAQAAFAFAVDLWEVILISEETIRVDACWSPLGQGVLGSAGAQSVSGNFTNAPISDIWYPAALANSLAGNDLDTSRSDIIATFNSEFSSWYFGTDGDPAFNQFDFVSVVLHELGHGLGFAGTMRVSGGSGSYGLGGFPIVYDVFTENGSNQNLINSFSNPSTALANQLTSGNIFFDGPNTNSANGNSPAELYAPNPFRQGSSFSHFDEVFNDTPDALMTFALSNGEALHDIGDVTLGLFTDMGWNLTTNPPPVPTVTPTSTATETAVPTETQTLVPTVTATATPTETAVPTETATVEPTAEATPESTATVEPTSEATPESTATVEPTAEATPESTATAEPTSEATPESTATAEPTAEATPESTQTITPMPTVEPTSESTPEPTASTTPVSTSVPTATQDPTLVPPTSLDNLIFLPLISR